MPSLGRSYWCHGLWGKLANLQITPTGQLHPCCLSLSTVGKPYIKGKPYNLYDNINCQMMIDLRKDLLNLKNEIGPTICNHCSNCCDLKDLKNSQYYMELISANKDIIIQPSDITKTVVIDISTHCQLKCPGCWRSTIPNLKKLAHMPPELVKILMESLPNAITIDISSNGESLLNPHFDEILDIMHSYNKRILSSCGVNFNHVTDSNLHTIIRTNAELTLSIDGASEESYKRYRIGGSFSKVIENIKRFNEIKKQYPQSTSCLSWRMILFDFNYKELDQVKMMVKDFGMDKLFLCENYMKEYPSYKEQYTSEIREIIKNSNNQVVR